MLVHAQRWPLIVLRVDVGVLKTEDTPKAVAGRSILRVEASTCEHRALATP